jgi:Ni,Fe-hydrogenase III large subunit/Ni,Fe-hydrogenase III component G
VTENALLEVDRVVGGAPDPERRLASARAYRVACPDLRRVVDRSARAGWRFASLIADERRPGDVALDYVFVAPGVDLPIVLGVLGVPAAGTSLASIALTCPGASWAEREARDLYGVAFADMPDPRPLVHHEGWPADEAPLRRDARGGDSPERVLGEYPFRRVEGEGVMEIRVGPIHAGIIEPGHFRFSAVGETVLGLEVRLLFVHRGVEKVAVGMSPSAAIVLGERVSGISSVAHSLAIARAMEGALGVTMPPSHAALRSLLLELERIYNHVGDLGNLCAGTALSGLLAEGLHLKERLFEANQRFTGTRYLRNLIGLGGVRRMPSRDEIRGLMAEVESVMSAAETWAVKFFGSASNLERLTGTGILSSEHAKNLATVGVVARASGLATDSRADLRFAAPTEGELYRDLRVVTETAGDVAARARVRLEEARESLRLGRRVAKSLEENSAATAGSPAEDSGEGLGYSESARGEIMTYVRLYRGRIARLKIRSPSRMNWPAIEHAMPGNIVPDFPLINKSFNLSYAGCDL